MFTRFEPLFPIFVAVCNDGIEKTCQEMGEKEYITFTKVEKVIMEDLRASYVSTQALNTLVSSQDAGEMLLRLK